MALAGLGSAGGDEAEVVEAMLLQPALTTFEIAFEASAILILLLPALSSAQSSSTPADPRVAGQCQTTRCSQLSATKAFLRGLALL